MLFVANANTNNLAVVNVKEPGAGAPLGFIPVGWYPTSVRVDRAGRTIYVTNGKGASPAAPIAMGRFLVFKDSGVPRWLSISAAFSRARCR